MEGGIPPLALLPFVKDAAEIGVSVLPMIIGIITLIISLIILIFGLITSSKTVKIVSYVGFGFGFLLIAAYMITRMIAASKK